MQYKIISVQDGDPSSRKGPWERDTQVSIEIGEDIPARIVPYWPQIVIALRTTTKLTHLISKYAHQQMYPRNLHGTRKPKS